MYNHNVGSWGPAVYGHEWWFINIMPAVAPLLLALVLWSLFWKGLALWHSAQRSQSWWFVILLVVNTLGILEIIYLFFIAKLHWRGLFKLHDRHHH
ncbi:MAG TPA: DUF5652 family protein [Candidatus Paceibacterota bacterium]